MILTRLPLRRRVATRCSARATCCCVKGHRSTAKARRSVWAMSVWNARLMPMPVLWSHCLMRLISPKHVTSRMMPRARFRRLCPKPLPKYFITMAKPVPPTIILHNQNLTRLAGNHVLPANVPPAWVFGIIPPFQALTALPQPMCLPPTAVSPFIARAISTVRPKRPRWSR